MRQIATATSLGSIGRLHAFLRLSGVVTHGGRRLGELQGIIVGRAGAGLGVENRGGTVLLNGHDVTIRVNGAPRAVLIPGAQRAIKAGAYPSAVIPNENIVAVRSLNNGDGAVGITIYSTVSVRGLLR